MPTIDFSKYKTTPTAPVGGSNQAPINFAKYKITQPGQTAASSVAPAPKTVAGMFGGAAKSIVGGVTDVANEAAKSGTRTILGLGGMGQGIEKGIGGAVDALDGGRTNLAKTGTGGIFDPNSPQGAAAQQITKRSPGLAGIIGTGIESAAELGIGEEKLAKPAIDAVKATKTVAEYLAKKTGAKILEAVSPKMTAKETADAIAKRGATKTGFLGRVKAAVDPAVQKVADAVQKHVPDFNPSKTFSENVNATRKAVYGMADDLKQQVVASGKDIIYPFRELASKMNAVEKPIAIKADAVLERQFNLAKDAAMKIAKKSGGKISDLLDARKEFDALVQKQFPNLYDKANAPMRDAISSMRGVMNDFIADNLPDVAFKDSLSAQSKLFTAIDNLSEKAASEVGTTAFGRAASTVRNHPVLAGFGGVGLYNEAKKIPVIGGILP